MSRGKRAQSDGRAKLGRENALLALAFKCWRGGGEHLEGSNMTPRFVPYTYSEALKQSP